MPVRSVALHSEDDHYVTILSDCLEEPEALTLARLVKAAVQLHKQGKLELEE